MRRLMEFVGCLVALAALLLAAVQLHVQGFLGYVVPPKVVAAVTIAVHGADEVLAGGEAVFVIKTTGDAGMPTVKLVPEDNAALTMIDERVYKFTTNKPGLYVLTASVGGEARMSATDSKVFEVVAVHEEPEQPQQPALPPLNLDALKALLSSHSQPQPPTVRELTAAALEQVDSGNRSEEARVILGILRQTINRIETGQIAPEGDPLGEFEDQLDLALGENARHWNTFAASLRGIVNSLREQGVVVTTPTAVPALEEMAAAVSSIVVPH